MDESLALNVKSSLTIIRGNYNMEKFLYMLSFVTYIKFSLNYNVFMKVKKIIFEL